MSNTRTQQRRFPLQLSDKEAERVSEFRWRNRIASQTEAIRQLIASGLKAEGKTKAATGAETPVAAE